MQEDTQRGGGGEMKKFILLMFVVLLIVIYPIISRAATEIGDKIHITGCENGVLQIPVVNMWSKPGGILAGAKVVGQLSGDGRADQGLKCQGAVVIIKDKQVVSGRTHYRVETIYGKVGWVTDSFIGRKAK